MSAYPAYTMGGLCIVGGVAGFTRTRSIPSLVAGVRYGLVCLVSPILTISWSSVGLLYLWSADHIRKGVPNGIEGAIGKNINLRFVGGLNVFMFQVHPQSSYSLPCQESQKDLYQSSWQPPLLPVGPTMGTH